MTAPALPPSEVQVFRNLLAASGRDPAAFAVEIRSDGRVHVTGPQASACYAADNWITRFSRHLDRGYFDPAGDPSPIKVH